jgi:ribonuclease BN (tRNA processing enzyme)
VVDGVAVTHLHGDHFGGLPFLILHRFRAVPGGAGDPERVVGPLPGGPRARARLPDVAGVAAARPAMLPARSAMR